MFSNKYMATLPFQLPQQTIASTNVAQPISTSIIAYSVLIYAQSSNVGVVTIGNSGVSVSTGAIRIGPDQSWLFDRVYDGYEKYDLNTIWISGQGTDKVMVSYLMKDYESR